MSISKYYSFLEKIRLESPQAQYHILRKVIRTDLYFLIWYGLARKDIEDPWLYERCKEVEANPDGYLDLWARAHYKSSIITFAKTIQDVLASHGEGVEGEKELTFGIFSHIRPIAKGFLRQIKNEFESNRLLLRLFPDVLYEFPKRDSPKWSEDDGLVLKRKSNPKEATIEAWGVVDGQPTGKHFDVLIYDDVIERRSTNSPEMLKKALEAWELSLNLGSRRARYRYIGTRYHYNDTYKTIMDRQAAIPRIYPATQDGTVNGKPVFLTKEELSGKLRAMGRYTFSSQMLQNPVPDSEQTFKREWIQYFEPDPNIECNKYMVVDPADSKRKGSDYTAIIVYGLGADENIYIFDIYRDKFSLTERAKLIFDLHRKWKPLTVGYEKSGLQTDISFIRELMRVYTYHFNLVAITPHKSKEGRIKSIMPYFESKRIFLPNTSWKTNFESKTLDVVQQFINEEYLCFPVSAHDDVLDALAYMFNEAMGVIYPMAEVPIDSYNRIGDFSARSCASKWVI
ncbi:MAG: phage terminase large subunit [Candidatus Peribacteraceae bacterium]|nr:phage terminase large subunit [Candidatus Peribacteraceae bacterium]